MPLFSLSVHLRRDRGGDGRTARNGERQAEQQQQQEEEEVATTAVAEKEEGVPSYNVKDAFGRAAGVRACVLRACEGLYTHEHARPTGECVYRM